MTWNLSSRTVDGVIKTNCLEEYSARIMRRCFLLNFGFGQKESRRNFTYISETFSESEVLIWLKFVLLFSGEKWYEHGSCEMLVLCSSACFYTDVLSCRVAPLLCNASLIARQLGEVSHDSYWRHLLSLVTSNPMPSIANAVSSGNDFLKFTVHEQFFQTTIFQWACLLCERY